MRLEGEELQTVRHTLEEFYCRSRKALVGVKEIR